MISKRDVQLLRRHDMTYAGAGPVSGAWRSPLLLCPRCLELMSKDQTGTCHCGTISVDREAQRIIVAGVGEQTVPCFNLAKR